MPEDTNVSKQRADTAAMPESDAVSIFRALATYGFAFLLGFLPSVWTAPGKGRDERMAASFPR